MKKLISTAMIGILACSSLAFADTTVPEVKSVLPQLQEKPPIEKPVGKAEMKLQLKQQQQQAKEAAKLEKQAAKKPLPDPAKIAQHRADLSKIIAQYAPTQMNAFKGAWQQIDSLRTAIEKIMSELREAKKADIQAKMEAIKADVVAGKLTKEAAKAQIEALKAALEAEREAVKSVFDAMRAEYGLGEGQVKALHEALKAAVAAKDEAGVVTVLNQLLELLGKRIEFLNTKLAYIQKL